jgi:flagellar basal body P-ring formation protein FlgA
MLRMALILLAFPVQAETLVAARTIRAQTILDARDLSVRPGSTPGTLSRIDEAVGLEARVSLYAGRPIRPDDLGPPAVIDRNQIVPLAYQTGRLSILAEGRSLGRAGIGDAVRVMNLASRATVTGRVRADGTVVVGHVR